MEDYHINLFYRDEDECYAADIPDLKFCSALGATQKKRYEKFSSPNKSG